MAPPRVEVHQFLPIALPRDAVTNHTLAMQRVLKRAGLGGQTWAEHVDPRLAHAIRRHNDRRAIRPKGAPMILLYQASTGSEGMAEWLAQQDEPLAIYYHGITPAELFRPYDGLAAAKLWRGREEMGLLARRTRLAFAASPYSATELRELGVRDVRILPPYGPRDAGAPDTAYVRELRNSKRGLDVLFVGKLVPNNGQLDLIRMLGVLCASFGRPVRLFLVGGMGPHVYIATLQRLVERLGLDGAVFFIDSLDQDKLAAHYLTADVFVCLSEHDGYCIPVLEAMRAGLPVVARDAGATAEIMDGTGVLLDTADPFVTAEVVTRVVTNQGLRSEIVRRGRERAAALDSLDRDGVLLLAVRELCED